SGAQVGPFGVAAELGDDIGADGDDLESLLAGIRYGLVDQLGGNAAPLIFRWYAGMVDGDRAVGRLAEGHFRLIAGGQMDDVAAARGAVFAQHGEFGFGHGGSRYIVLPV